MNLGESIYRLRTKVNMSQGDLADALEVSRQSVSKWENNSATPELEKLIKMSRLFGVTLDELVSGEEPASPPPVQEASAAPTSTERFPARKIVGIVLLSLGLVCILVCTILAVMMGNLYEEDLISAAFIMGAPLVLIGILFLAVRYNPGYWCSLCLYFGAWLSLSILFGGFGAMGAFIRIVHCLAGLWLLIWTLTRFRSDRLHIPKWGKFFICAALLLSILMSIVFLLSPVSESVVNADVIVIPIS